jgi:antitoxin component of MazEF toxin-antitoxin module
MMYMIPTLLRPRKVGNSMVVTIPADICEQLKIDGNTLLQVTIQPVEQVTVPRLDPVLQRALDQVLEHDQAALRYLGGKPPADEDGRT